MAILRFHNIGITALSACVPAKIERNRDLDYMIPVGDIEKIINTIGIEEKRIVDDDVCTSDLCYKAAKKLLEDRNIDLATISALVFVSQTPDYHQPATAPILQNRLGLPETTLSFDVNLACSGYVYGLSIAYSFASQNGVDKVLLLVGDTMSKIVSRHDKASKPLFGDAGTATLVEKGDFGESVFSLNSDGSGADMMMVPYGGYRHQSCEEGLTMTEDSTGISRCGEQFRMDGMDVFNFGMRVEPKEVRSVLSAAGLSIDDLNLLLFHQSNKFLLDFYARKLSLPSAKMPSNLRRFGNTSSASIPLTIVTELKDGYPQRERVVLSGYGAGLSWGSVLLDLRRCRISDLIEY